MDRYGQVSDSMCGEWDRKISYILKYGDLSEWEKGFMKRISLKRGTSKNLSIKESFKLGKIYKVIERLMG